MGIKIFDKRNLEKKLREAKKKLENLDADMKIQDNMLTNIYLEIGQTIVVKGIQVDNSDIEQLRNDVVQLKMKIEELQEEKENMDKEVFLLEEGLRNIDGKVGCPKCGQVYEKKKDLLFCPKCGTSLTADSVKEP